MRKAILAGALGLMTAASLAMPQLANAAGDPPLYNGGDCSGMTQVTVGGTTVGVGVRAADPAVAVCVDNLPTSGAGFSGGAIEAGATLKNGPTRLCVASTPVDTSANPVGVYLIADGDRDNTANLAGYAGLSNYETAGSNEDCNQSNNGDGTNSGGAVGPDGGPNLPIPLIVCGFTSGRDYIDNGRDGCYFP